MSKENKNRIPLYIKGKKVEMNLSLLLISIEERREKLDPSIYKKKRKVKKK